MFSHFFIDRPIFATVTSVVIVIVGAVALVALPIAQYPEVTPPTISVTATYPGANAQVVADTVATPIEQQVNGVEDMLYMLSKCTNDGQMLLDVTFQLGTDLDMAQVLVQNRVAIAEASLPEEVKRQGVQTKKKSPSILLCVNLISPDDTYDQLYISNYATTRVKDRLARIEGVGDVSLLGARDYSMRIWLDPNKVAARGMTAADVVNALREQNVQVAAGRIGQPPSPSDQDYVMPISTRGRLLEPEEFDNIILRTGADGQLTRVRDVAYTELGAKNYDVNSYLDGQPSVTLAVFQLPGSNAVETAENVYREMEKLSDDFPPGIDYAIAYDTTGFIEESIASVVHTLIEAIVLVFLVVLLFLQNWRATLVPMVAVPVSLVGTFAFMALLGFSLNNLSLFGLVLAIGIVVDDAIVVVENVERNMALGLSPREASRKSMVEVSGAIIATTLVMCAVFVPCAFIAGISGQFYTQFALTIAVSTVISAFNSLTMSPALCALLLKPHGAARDPITWAFDTLLGWFFRGFNRTFDLMRDGYGAVVHKLLRGAVVVLIVYVGLLVLTGYGFSVVPAGFIPEQDKGYLLVNAQLPGGASVQRTEEVMARLDKMALNTPGVAHTLRIPGYSALTSTNISNTGTMFVILAPFEERESAGDIAMKLRAQFGQVLEAATVVFGAPPIDGLGNTGGFKLQVQDYSDSGPTALKAAVDSVIVGAQAQPGLVGLFSSYSANDPQLYANIDREKVKAQGVKLDDVNATLQVYLGSAYANDFTRFGRNWQVNVQADASFRRTPEDIGRLQVRNPDGRMVPLRTYVDVRDTSGPAIVNHYNLFPSAEISGSTLPGMSSGQAIQVMEATARRELPQGMGFEWTELTLQQILAGNTAVFVFALGTLLVFLVLSAQYESWALPLSVILIVPMCLLCAIAGVWITGSDNNIFTQIGFVVLIGLAAKNAILIVEFAKERHEAGLNHHDAALEASRLRLRPILMTSLAFILGVVPLITSAGAGAEMRVALGIAVFSGMLGVTLFGIFFTPVFFTVVMWFRKAKPQPAPVAEAAIVEGSQHGHATGGTP